MLNKKMIINKNNLVEVIYQDWNVNASGGIRKQDMDTMRFDLVNQDSNRYSNRLDKNEEPGKFHTKNYKQRKSTRTSVVML